MPNWLTTFLGWFGYKKATPSPSTASTSPTLSVGVVTDVGEGFQAVTAISNVIQQEDAEMNTPAMISAAEGADKQAKIDRFNQDLQDGNTPKIGEEIAGK